MIRITFLFFVLLLWPFRSAYSQSSEDLKRLQLTIDSLKLELERCQRLIFAKAEEVPLREYRQQLIDSLKSNFEGTLSDVIVLSQQVDKFIDFCDQLREEIIGRTGGYSQKNRPIGLANKAEVSKLFLEEKQAEVLRVKMMELRANMLRITKNRIDEDQISTGSPLKQETDKSWEEYRFQNMPTAAVLPLLAKFKDDALQDEITTLTWLVEKY